MTQTTCPTCGTRFTPTTGAQRYCQPRCRRRRPRPSDPSHRDPALASRARRRTVARVRREESHCWLCGYPIDLGLDPQRHPLGSVVDEIIPRKHGGDPTDRANCRHAHRLCNGIRCAKPVTPELRIHIRAKVEELLRELGVSAAEGLSRRW